MDDHYYDTSINVPYDVVNCGIFNFNQSSSFFVLHTYICLHAVLSTMKPYYDLNLHNSHGIHYEY